MSQVEAAARLASAGVGPALVPENAIPDGLSGSILPVDPPLGRELAMYTRAAWTPAAGAFAEVVRSVRWVEPPADATLIA